MLPKLRHLQQPLGLHHRVRLQVVLSGAQELGVEEQLGPLAATQHAARMDFGTLATGQGQVRVVLLQLRHVVKVAHQKALLHVRKLRRRRIFDSSVLRLLVLLRLGHQFTLATDRLQLLAHLRRVRQVPVVEKVLETKDLERKTKAISFNFLSFLKQLSIPTTHLP